jgi:hypothetical protein
MVTVTPNLTHGFLKLLKLSSNSNECKPLVGLGRYIIRALQTLLASSSNGMPFDSINKGSIGVG